MGKAHQGLRGITVHLPDELEERFRAAAMRRFGYGKGSLSSAAQEKSEACEAFLGKVRDGDKEGFVTDFSVYSIMLIMEHHDKKEELKEFIKGLPAYEGLTDKLAAIDLAAATGLDIEDSIQHAAAAALGVEGNVSVDRHFDGLV